MKNYYAIEPIEAYVQTDLILNHWDENYNSPFKPCEIIAVIFYVGEAPTFMIKLEDGEIFRYIPSDKLSLTKQSLNVYELNDLVYHNSLDDDVKISVITTLNGESSCYIKDKDEWISSEYIMSFDFYKKDRMLNLMKLDNGQLAFLPFHKIKFKNIDTITKKFNSFKKQTKKYIVIDN